MSRTNLNDFQDATEAIDALLLKYAAHKGQKWLKQGVRDQMVHVRNHLDTVSQMTRDLPMERFDFEDFVSLGCRALMLLQHAIMRYPEEHKTWKEAARDPQKNNPDEPTGRQTVE